MKLSVAVVDAVLSHPEPPSAPRHSFPQLPEVLAADGSQVNQSPETALSQRDITSDVMAPFHLIIRQCRCSKPHPPLASSGDHSKGTSQLVSNLL